MSVRLLETGIYTVSDAARLLHVPPRKIRGWVAGYPKTKAPPILDNEVGWRGGALALGFANLMEIRFIEHFAGYGVRVGSIRRMAEEAKRLLGHQHPFATDTIFKTDGRRIFAEVAEETGDKRLYDLHAKNWAFYEVIASFLRRDVAYNPSGEAEYWYPRRETAPNVILHPKMAFGQPVLGDSGVPTRALYDAFRAEGETFETVAVWFDVPAEQVKEAVRFELDLMKKAA